VAPACRWITGRNNTVPILSPALDGRRRQGQRNRHGASTAVSNRGSDIDHDRYAWCRHDSLWPHDDGTPGVYCSGPHYKLADGQCACRAVPQANRGVPKKRKVTAAAKD
jgi:hypothetical protein